MSRAVAVLLVASLGVAGCAKIRESRINPFNWFGPSESRAVTLDPGYAATADNRLLVAEVTQLDISRTAGGAIVHAAGLPQTQGWWDAELVAENGGEPVDGVMTYRFVVMPPPAGTRVSTPQSRELTAAVHLSDNKLAEIDRIVVLGTANSRSVSR